MLEEQNTDMLRINLLAKQAIQLIQIFEKWLDLKQVFLKEVSYSHQCSIYWI